MIATQRTHSWDHPTKNPPARTARRGSVLGALEPAGVALAALLVLLTSSCTSLPEEQQFDNPFAPTAPGYEDPFDVEAVYVPHSVVVSWQPIQRASIRSYHIWRKGTLNGIFTQVDTVKQPTKFDRLQFLDSNYNRFHDNFYQVTAHAGGQATYLSKTVVAQVFAPPEIEILNDPGKLRTRTARLQLRASQGDSLQVALRRDFAGAMRVLRNTQTAVTDTTIDVGPASEGDTVRVYVRGWLGGVSSPPDSAIAAVEFDPRPKPPASAIENPVIVHMRETGLLQARWSLRLGDLPSANWEVPAIDPDTSLTDRRFVSVGLAAGVTVEQKIYLETQCDFGYTRVDSIVVQPLLVEPQCSAAGDSCFTIDNGAGTTAGPRVMLRQRMTNASRMRFTETLPISDVPWSAYADSVEFDLSPDAGDKTVYGQFANDFDVQGQTSLARILRLSAAAPPASGAASISEANGRRPTAERSSKRPRR